MPERFVYICMQLIVMISRNIYGRKIKNPSSNNYMLICAFIHIQIYEGVKKTAVIPKKIYLFV